MSVLLNADRARARYAAALYRSALLGDPRPHAAGRAVVAAFRAIPWDDIAFDDHLEARLVASLPPLSRLRLRPTRAIVGLPTAFWKLPANTRLGLGLRLLRGMGIMQIAQALRLPISDTRALLLNGLRALDGEREPLPEACHSYFTARLDAPNAERGHLLVCAACRMSVPRWERIETALAEQLGHAVGSVPLPQAVDEQLNTALNTAGQAEPLRLWQRPPFLQGAIVSVMLLGLLALFWPQGEHTFPVAGTTNLTPAAIIAVARRDYATIPPVEGILHRHWTITLGRPYLNFDADEWVDPQQPARHWMQLVRSRTIEEWQVGDGQDHLSYTSSLEPYYCGSAPLGVLDHSKERNNWPMKPAEQAAMRTARWQHGAWATGLHYLEVAARVDTIRSLGVVGSGQDATLTLSAEGHTISGTLLLRFDPLLHTLREVHELQRNNGQTEERIPWRLVSSETLQEQTVVQHNLLTAYPSNTRPRLVERSLPVLDQGCPLAGAEQTLSLPRLLTVPNLGPIIGLGELPKSLSQAVIIGPSYAPGRSGASNQQFDFGYNNFAITYLGPSKRLVFLPYASPVGGDHLITVGSWRVQFLPQNVPTVLTAVLQRVDFDPQHDDGQNHGNHLLVLAEDWTRDELTAMVASVRPLGVDDWMRAPDRFYEPAPLSPASKAHLITVFKGARSYPSQTHHQVKLETTRQAPFLADLHDPYHTPLALWPPVRRTESWSEHDADNRERRAIRITRDMAGRVLYVQWHDDQTLYNYDGASYSIISQPFQDGFMSINDDVQPIAGFFDWHWEASPGGQQVAEQPKLLKPVPDYTVLSSHGTVYLDNWTYDLAADTGLERRTFDSDGNLRTQETLAVLGAATVTAQNDLVQTTTAPTSTVTIWRSVIEKNEWLPNVAPNTFVWTPPAGTKQMSEEDMQIFYHHLNDQPVWVQNVAEVAATMPFPIWNWSPKWTPPTEAPVFGGIMHQPPLNSTFLPVLPGTIGNAVNLGVAVDGHYLLYNRSVDILQGPAPLLHQLLQQTPPRWTSAEQRTIAIRGQLQTVWTMRGPTEKRGANVYYNRSIVFELDGTLFFIRADVQDVDLDKIIQHLDGLRPVAPNRRP